MFCHWMPLQELAVEDPLVAAAPDLQLLPGRTQLQSQLSHLLLHRRSLNHLLSSHKVASGEVLQGASWVEY